LKMTSTPGSSHHLMILPHGNPALAFGGCE
jgi:hypothetical protein